MIVKKITYNDGKNEGYYVRTRKGYLQVMIKEGETFDLKRIKKEVEIRINEANLKIEEVEKNETYIA